MPCGSWRWWVAEDIGERHQCFNVGKSLPTRVRVRVRARTPACSITISCSNATMISNCQHRDIAALADVEARRKLGGAWAWAGSSLEPHTGKGHTGRT